jgi:hypothetical protein
LILAALLTATTGSALYALDFSAGGGLILGGTWTKSETEPAAYTSYMTGSASPATIAMQYSTSRCDFGFEACADCTYAELALAYMLQYGNVTDVGMNMGGGFMPQADQDYANQNLLVDVLGKYPFTMSEKLALFPALGLALRFPVAGNDNSDYAKKQGWALGIKGGGGVDFALTDVLFLRGELLCYFELAADKKITVPSLALMGAPTDLTVKSAGYYVSPQLKLLVGYKISSNKAPAKAQPSDEI